MNGVIVSVNCHLAKVHSVRVRRILCPAKKIKATLIARSDRLGSGSVTACASSLN